MTKRGRERYAAISAVPLLWLFSYCWSSASALTVNLNEETRLSDFCRGALIFADDDADRRLGRDEFVSFLRILLRDRSCEALGESAVEIPMGISGAFNLLACQCRLLGGAPDCCRGDNAHVSNSGAGMGETFETPGQEEYLNRVCILADQVVANACPEPDPSLPPTEPTTVSTETLAPTPAGTTNVVTLAPSISPPLATPSPTNESLSTTTREPSTASPTTLYSTLSPTTFNPITSSPTDQQTGEPTIVPSTATAIPTTHATTPSLPPSVPITNSPSVGQPTEAPTEPRPFPGTTFSPTNISPTPPPINQPTEAPTPEQQPTLGTTAPPTTAAPTLPGTPTQPPTTREPSTAPPTPFMNNNNKPSTTRLAASSNPVVGTGGITGITLGVAALLFLLIAFALRRRRKVNGHPDSLLFFGAGAAQRSKDDESTTPSPPPPPTLFVPPFIVGGSTAGVGGTTASSFTITPQQQEKKDLWKSSTQQWGVAENHQEEDEYGLFGAAHSSSKQQAYNSDIPVSSKNIYGIVPVPLSHLSESQRRPSSRSRLYNLDRQDMEMPSRGSSLAWVDSVDPTLMDSNLTRETRLHNVASKFPFLLSSNESSSEQSQHRTEKVPHEEAASLAGSREGEAASLAGSREGQQFVASKRSIQRGPENYEVLEDEAYEKQLVAGDRATRAIGSAYPEYYEIQHSPLWTELEGDQRKESPIGSTSKDRGSEWAVMRSLSTLWRYVSGETSERSTKKYAPLGGGSTSKKTLSKEGLSQYEKASQPTASEKVRRGVFSEERAPSVDSLSACSRSHDEDVADQAQIWMEWNRKSAEEDDFSGRQTAEWAVLRSLSALKRKTAGASDGDSSDDERKKNSRDRAKRDSPAGDNFADRLALAESTSSENSALNAADVSEHADLWTQWSKQPHDAPGTTGNRAEWGVLRSLSALLKRENTQVKISADSGTLVAQNVVGRDSAVTPRWGQESLATSRRDQIPPTRLMHSMDSASTMDANPEGDVEEQAKLWVEWAGAREEGTSPDIDTAEWGTTQSLSDLQRIRYHQEETKKSENEVS